MVEERLDEESNKRKQVEEELESVKAAMESVKAAMGDRLDKESNKRKKVEEELESVKATMHNLWGNSTVLDSEPRFDANRQVIQVVQKLMRNEIIKSKKRRANRPTEEAAIEKPMQRDGEAVKGQEMRKASTLWQIK